MHSYHLVLKLSFYLIHELRNKALKLGQPNSVQNSNKIEMIIYLKYIILISFEMRGCLMISVARPMFLKNIARIKIYRQ